MCEWLSCSEWCDVQLQCGGRTFSAHRAVLASVSTFLRKILLSCPLEESPTFIVLPDFDIEAMSSVLYYIYNGEVIIEKQKLEMFLDIIKAMQIFIDNQYLPACNNVDDIDMFSSMHKQSKINNVFSLGTTDCEEQYVNLNRREQIHETFSQHSHSCTDFRDKQVKCQKDWRDQFKPSLGNLQSPNADRQRNSFLRDLFMETYPRNGNANGRSAGVLAISNERYRTPTSVFLTNANGKLPREDNTLVETRNTFEHKSCLSTIHPLTQLDCIQTSKEYADYKSYATNSNLNMSRTRSKINYFPHPNPFYSGLGDVKDKCVPSLDLSITESILTSSSKMAESVNQYLLAAQRPIQSFNVKHCKDDHKKVKNNYLTSSKTSNLVKGAILNQVLDSPWCPRLPRDYRPFRRKIQSATNSPNIGKEENVNDSNNNIQTSTLTPSPDITLDKDPTTEESKVQPTAYSIASLVADNDYTCTICNQVLTSSTSLSTHMRRHSSTRYTCTECSKSFSQLRNFKYHMSVHRGTKEFAATCTVCGKYFNDRGYLSSHMKIHRNRKEYKCSQCPKSFNQRVAYNMHVRIHTGVKPHACTECGKAFSRKMLLKQHQRTHSGEKPYACPHCDKRFADRSNMTLHLRLHTGIKPFSCSLCPKSFTKKHHLKSHLNFHTGAKPYSCPRCKLAFTQSSNMRTHLKKCSAPAPTDYTGTSDS